MERNILLVSNSKMHGKGYLDHCEEQIHSTLEGCTSIMFVPYARPSGMTWEAYTSIARDRFAKMGIRLYGIHETSLTDEAVKSAEAIFIGGGNTFVLLRELLNKRIVDIIWKRVIHEGMPYLGASAGANVAGRTIKTTNDMPIEHPSTFAGIGLVQFLINPHYIDTDSKSTHMGETRETRIKEYQAFNDDTVVALREGSMLRVQGSKATLLGTTNARIFRKGSEPTEHVPGESLDFLLIDGDGSSYPRMPRISGT